MILEGKIDIAAPTAEVWAFLTDIDRFASCVPGLERATAIDDRTFEGLVTATVGPISGNFTFRSTIVESAPPTSMTVQTDGTDSVTKSAVGAKLVVKLEETGAKRTALDYRADIAIKGRLAILGDMVMRATGALLLEEFARRLKERLET